VEGQETAWIETIMRWSDRRLEKTA
jgi:hypothetical protein